MRKQYFCKLTYSIEFLFKNACQIDSLHFLSSELVLLLDLFFDLLTTFSGRWVALDYLYQATNDQTVPKEIEKQDHKEEGYEGYPAHLVSECRLFC